MSRGGFARTAHACGAIEKSQPKRTGRESWEVCRAMSSLVTSSREYRGYGGRGAETMERQYQRLARFRFGENGCLPGKSYCFNGMRRSKLTSLPSGRSTRSAGTKTPRTNRARMVREGFGRTGADGGASGRLSRAVAGAI